MKSTLLRCIYYFGVFGPMAGAVALSIGVLLTGLLSGQVTTLEDLLGALAAFGMMLLIGAPLSIFFAGVPAALTGVVYWLWRDGQLPERPPLLVAMGFATGAGVVVTMLCAAIATGNLLPLSAAGLPLALPVLAAGPACAAMVERWVWPPDSDTQPPSQDPVADESSPG